MSWQCGECKGCNLDSDEQCIVCLRWRGRLPAALAAALKDTNPKDAVGIKKVPASCVPRAVLAEAGLAMMEGALKYGRHNYRVAGVRSSVYFDACHRHLDSWWEGEDIDPDSGLSHVTKAIATLVVLRDAMINDMVTDDRPPPTKEGWMKRLNDKASALLAKYPQPVPAHTKENS